MSENSACLNKYWTKKEYIDKYSGFTSSSYLAAGFPFLLCLRLAWLYYVPHYMAVCSFYTPYWTPIGRAQKRTRQTWQPSWTLFVVEFIWNCGIFPGRNCCLFRFVLGRQSDVTSFYWQQQWRRPHNKVLVEQTADFQYSVSGLATSCIIRSIHSFAPAGSRNSILQHVGYYLEGYVFLLSNNGSPYTEVIPLIPLYCIPARLRCHALKWIAGNAKRMSQNAITSL